MGSKWLPADLGRGLQVGGRVRVGESCFTLVLCVDLLMSRNCVSFLAWLQLASSCVKRCSTLRGTPWIKGLRQDGKCACTCPRRLGSPRRTFQTCCTANLMSGSMKNHRQRYLVHTMYIILYLMFIVFFNILDCGCTIAKLSRYPESRGLVRLDPHPLSLLLRRSQTQQ